MFHLFTAFLILEEKENDVEVAEIESVNFLQASSAASRQTQVKISSHGFTFTKLETFSGHI